MGRWVAVAGTTASRVSELPRLWVAGALAWIATVGPIPLLVAVVPLPAASDLTFAATGTLGSGAWPWNVVALAALTALLLVIALALLALADLAILAPPSVQYGAAATAARSLAVTMLCAAPVLALAGVLVAGLAVAGLDEFRAPDSTAGGPIVRTALRVVPLAGILAAAVALAGSVAAAARVRVVGGALILPALAASLFAIATRPGAALHAIVAPLLRALYLVFATVLLAVLWAPLGLRLGDRAGFGAAESALLVGFVAIWLCLVLGGGAVHAWASLTTAGIIETRSRPAGTEPEARSAQ